MRYVEVVFDIAYFTFIIFAGAYLLITRPETPLLGAMTFVLGMGDAFHLVPRMAKALGVRRDLTFALGYGKLITSVTMTAFYVLLYFAWSEFAVSYDVNARSILTAAILILAGLRVTLCLFPQNRWRENLSGGHFAIIRNMPFIALGALVAVLCLMTPSFLQIGIAVVGSFAFYLPVIFGAEKNPKLGMLMLPKTLMYVWIIVRLCHG
jgi:hypothetical protein